MRRPALRRAKSIALRRMTKPVDPCPPRRLRHKPGCPDRIGGSLPRRGKPMPAFSWRARAGRAMARPRPAFSWRIWASWPRGCCDVVPWPWVLSSDRSNGGWFCADGRARTAARGVGPAVQRAHACGAGGCPDRLSNQLVGAGIGDGRVSRRLTKLKLPASTAGSSSLKAAAAMIFQSLFVIASWPVFPIHFQLSAQFSSIEIR